MQVPFIHTNTRYENKQHGSSDFPFVVYQSAIPDYMGSYPLHWHNEMELIYVTFGSCIITVNKIPLHANAGDIIPILPGMLHSIEQDGENHVIYYNIVFDLKLLGQNSPSDACFRRYLNPYLNGTIHLPLKITPNNPQYLNLRFSLDILSKYSASINPGDELLIKAELFALFYRLEPLKHTNDPAYNTNTHADQIQKMKELLAFITKNYAKPLTLQEAADFCGYSVSYFMKFFKSFTGSTFIGYLNDYRLKIAGELLCNTNLTILEISESVGFENHSYFIRIFKREYGITPKKYRMQHARH
jgi:AraC-like DNA-binding protein